MQEIMQMPEGLLPVVMKCIDEDYFLDVRRATTHVMYQILRVSGLILSGSFLMSWFSTTSLSLISKYSVFLISDLLAVQVGFITIFRTCNHLGTNVISSL